MGSPLNLPPTHLLPQDIDLMWHAHMGGGTYAKDTVASFGKVFDHNDNVNEAELGQAFETTKVLFESRFPGSVYNPPPTQVQSLSSGERSWA